MQGKLLTNLSNPYFLFCFIPGFYLLFGTLYAIQYSSIDWLSFFLLYLFVMSNQLLEKKFNKNYDLTSRSAKRSVIILEILLFLILFYFGIVHSLITSLLLICYAIMIQGQFSFSYYNLSLFSMVLVTIFKVFLLNALSFYLHTGFIPIRLLLWTSPLFLPILLGELFNWEKPLNKKKITAILLFSYFIGMLLMWLIADLYALILLFSVPFGFIFLVDPNKRTNQLFTASYIFTHFLVALFAFLSLI